MIFASFIFQSSANLTQSSLVFARVISTNNNNTTNTFEIILEQLFRHFSPEHFHADSTRSQNIYQQIQLLTISFFLFF